MGYIIGDRRSYVGLFCIAPVKLGFILSYTTTIVGLRINDMNELPHHWKLSLMNQQ